MPLEVQHQANTVYRTPVQTSYSQVARPASIISLPQFSAAEFPEAYTPYQPLYQTPPVKLQYSVQRTQVSPQFESQSNPYDWPEDQRGYHPVLKSKEKRTWLYIKVKLDCIPRAGSFIKNTPGTDF